MNYDYNDKKVLIPFLRELADKIEQNELEPEELQRIGSFFMNYHFETQLEKDEELSSEFDKDELMKFCSLGWYVYRVLLKDIKI